MDVNKTIRLMLAFFGEAIPPRCQHITGADVPEPYHRLLVHDGHMTVTLEDHYQKTLVVRAYKTHSNGDWYGRKLDLLLADADYVVMTGVMLFNFGYCTEKVRDLILAQRTPLGRILIENNVLRRISASSFLRIEADDPLVARFGLKTPTPAFGRLAEIYCDEQPAVDLLEIVRPVEPDA